MARKKKKKSGASTIENRKARCDYHIDRTLEVGIALRGTEVKAAREGKVSLAEGYVRAESDPPSLTLHSVHIAEYPPAGPMQHEPTRTRKLLAHRKELRALAKECQARGVPIVPLKFYFKEGWAKLLVGVAIGKKKADKRAAIADREAKRDIERALSRKR